VCSFHNIRASQEQYRGEELNEGDNCVGTALAFMESSSLAHSGQTHYPALGTSEALISAQVVLDVIFLEKAQEPASYRKNKMVF
jgi:hypothetical protein